MAGGCSVKARTMTFIPMDKGTKQSHGIQKLMNYLQRQ